MSTLIPIDWACGGIFLAVCIGWLLGRASVNRRHDDDA